MRSTALIRLSVLLAVAACLCQPADAVRKARRRPVSRPVSQDVQPSPEIETQIADAVSQAARILEDLNRDNVLASPYLVSAIYYHDDFLSTYSVDRATADPERRIIGQISKLLTPAHKVRFLQLLHEIWARYDSPGGVLSAEPVAYKTIGGARTHRYAVDLFAQEGATVHAVSRGLIVLADRDWNPANLFSTTSRKGGNSVILFDPDHDRFYRYCHMDAVGVSVGKLAAAGESLGNVGHTGLNASRPGHGRHLHFETNQYLDGHVTAIDYRQLRAWLKQWRSDVQKTDEALLENTKTQLLRTPVKR
jgi:murein DD-endopeptidase MepM/ murein hydrolase activator NlpD